MRRFLSVMLTVSILCFSSGLSLAQEQDMDYVWGTVVKVSPEEITVSEYEYDLDEEIDVVYKIDPDVKLEGIDVLNELSEGDSIEIAYVIKGKNKIAKSITLEGTYYDSEELEQESEYLPEREEDIEY